MDAPVTVIVPSRDRYRDLRRCLLALVDCDTTLLHEVLVIDDGSQPRIGDASVPGLPVRVIRNARPQGAMRARSLGAGRASSPMLAFLDDDALPRADWLNRIAEELTPGRGGITGRVLPFDAGLVSKARQARYMERYRGLSHGESVDFFAGGNSAVWREAFLQAGGMTSAGPGGDNKLVAELERLGLSVHFVPSLVVVHRNGKGFSQAVRTAFGAGRHHDKPLSVPAALHRATQAVPGATPSVRLTNRVLNVAHLAGRCLPHSAKES
ncbi:glycosyltransferase family 2 protein [Nonomuraea sp. NPDC003727]